MLNAALMWLAVAILAALIWIAIAALNRRWARMEREQMHVPDNWCPCATCRALFTDETDNITQTKSPRR